MADLMQQARELLPCPFCGGEATLRMIGNVHSTRKCVVKCSGCRYERTDAVLRYGDEWLLKTAIAAWNRRSAMRAAPEGYVLVPVEPTREMMDAGRTAVMAAKLASQKWTPRQHYEASGQSMAGIPEDVLDEHGPLTKESVAAMVFGSMVANRPGVAHG